MERYIEEGARVGVIDRFPDRIEQLREDFCESLVGIPGDVARLDDNKAAVAETVRQFGRLDIYADNAGVFDSNHTIDDIPEELLSDSFDELFGVNVKGLLLVTKAALPELRKTEGCIVFTASVAGINSGGASLCTPHPSTP